MNLRPIVAAAPEVALRGTVLRLVQQQGINSLEPLVDNLEQLARLEAMVETSKPPLRHGSRFGSRQYRGIFYGSRSRRRQTLFSVLLNASRGLRLQAITAEAAQANLQDPLAYGPSQQLGEWMRDHRQITTFLCQDNGKLHRFGRELFLIDGAFPGAAL
jgi:hypothetical protein